MALLSSAAHDIGVSLPGKHASNLTLSSCASSENLANLLLAIVRYAAALPVACPAYLATLGRSLGPAAVSLLRSGAAGIATEIKHARKDT